MICLLEKNKKMDQVPGAMAHVGVTVLPRSGFSLCRFLLQPFFPPSLFLSSWVGLVISYLVNVFIGSFSLMNKKSFPLCISLIFYIDVDLKFK